MATQDTTISGDIQRELGKISATLDEILRRLDTHAQNEKDFEKKIEHNESTFNSRLSALESRMNYGLGIGAATIFFFEVLLKIVKVS